MSYPGDLKRGQAKRIQDVDLRGRVDHHPGLVRHWKDQKKRGTSLACFPDRIPLDWGQLFGLFAACHQALWVFHSLSTYTIRVDHPDFGR